MLYCFDIETSSSPVNCPNCRNERARVERQANAFKCKFFSAIFSFSSRFFFISTLFYIENIFLNILFQSQSSYRHVRLKFTFILSYRLNTHFIRYESNNENSHSYTSCLIFAFSISMSRVNANWRIEFDEIFFFIRVPSLDRNSMRKIASLTVWWASFAHTMLIWEYLMSFVIPRIVCQLLSQRGFSNDPSPLSEDSKFSFKKFEPPNSKKSCLHPQTALISIICDDCKVVDSNWIKFSVIYYYYYCCI